MKTIFTTAVAFLFWSATAVLFAQSSKTEDEPPEIRVVFYNLENWLRQDRISKGEFIPEVPKPDEEKKVIAATFARLRPEVIGVCEMGDARDMADFQRRLKSVGLEYPHTEWVDSVDPVRHLALFSQFPIVERNSETDLVYVIDQTEFAYNRGILDVTLQVTDDYQLRCLGTHLKSKREDPRADQALMRRNEAHLFRKHVETIFDEDPDVNLLAFGDFNDTRNEVSIKAVQGKFGSERYLAALNLEDRYGFNWTHFWDTAGSYSRIDFMFVSKGLTREVNRDKSFVYHFTLQDDKDAWRRGSDHRPLVASIIAKDLERRK